MMPPPEVVKLPLEVLMPISEIGMGPLELLFRRLQMVGAPYQSVSEPGEV